MEMSNLSRNLQNLNAKLVDLGKLIRDQIFNNMKIIDNSINYFAGNGLKVIPKQPQSTRNPNLGVIGAVNGSKNEMSISDSRGTKNGVEYPNDEANINVSEDEEVIRKDRGKIPCIIVS